MIKEVFVTSNREKLVPARDLKGQKDGALKDLQHRECDAAEIVTQEGASCAWGGLGSEE